MEPTVLAAIEQLHEQLVSHLERTGTRREDLSRDRLLEIIKQLIASTNDHRLADKNQQSAVAERLLNSVAGLGPLEAVLTDPDISEIMINGLESTFIERQGQLTKIPLHFINEQEILRIINRIVGPVGRRIDESSPLVDARLPDGSRVNAIIAPLSRIGPVLTIRRFPSHPLTLRNFIARGTATDAMLSFLQAAVNARLNILISGSTGSGKTTTLNALGSEISASERLITIEDTAEMKLTHPHLIRLEAREANTEGQGEVTIRTLLKNALRMRPDRIIVGETRGGEALDMLQAMNTGHQGSLTTVHANSPEEALLRLETMALMADIELPLPAIREQIKSAIHLIVQQERLPGGERKIVAISEVQPSRHMGEHYEVIPLFIFDKHTQTFRATGRIPAREHLFNTANAVLNPAWFIEA